MTVHSLCGELTLRPCSWDIEDISYITLHASDIQSQMHLDGCDVWIQSDEQVLPEFLTTIEVNDGTPETRTISCWIPSEAGMVRLPSAEVP